MTRVTGKRTDAQINRQNEALVVTIGKYFFASKLAEAEGTSFKWLLFPVDLSVKRVVSTLTFGRS